VGLHVIRFSSGKKGNRTGGVGSSRGKKRRRRPGFISSRGGGQQETGRCMVVRKLEAATQHRSRARGQG
jgi:hypothetical protein